MNLNKETAEEIVEAAEEVTAEPAKEEKAPKDKKEKKFILIRIVLILATTVFITM